MEYRPPLTAPSDGIHALSWVTFVWLPHVPHFGLHPLPSTRAAPNDGLHALSWGSLFGSVLLALASVLCAVVLPAVLGAARCLAAGAQLGTLPAVCRMLAKRCKPWPAACGKRSHQSVCM